MTEVTSNTNAETPVVKDAPLSIEQRLNRAEANIARIYDHLNLLGAALKFISANVHGLRTGGTISSLQGAGQTPGGVLEHLPSVPKADLPPQVGNVPVAG